jgi:hypothetical protein
MPPGAAIFPGMSMLTEIENAVVSLPSAQQENLLLWLQSRLAHAPAAVAVRATDRRSWIGRLARLRQLGSTGRPGTPLQRIMDDLRGE